MVVVHDKNSTTLGAEWEIELIDIEHIEQAMEELGMMLSNHGYFASMFDVWSILQHQFFNQNKKRGVILIPASNAITDFI